MIFTILFDLPLFLETPIYIYTPFPDDGHLFTREHSLHLRLLCQAVDCFCRAPYVVAPELTEKEKPFDPEKLLAYDVY